MTPSEREVNVSQNACGFSCDRAEDLVIIHVSEVGGQASHEVEYLGFLTRAELTDRAGGPLRTHASYDSELPVIQ